MKKLCIFILIVLFARVLIPAISHAQNMEDIKAQARAQVRREMGLDKPQEQYVAREREVKVPVKDRLVLLQEVALVGFIIALIPAAIAKVKGRSFIAWWVLGLVGFIIALPASIFMKDLPKPKKKKRKQKPEPVEVVEESDNSI